jgi:PAS domain S-box-containing protein
VRQRPVLLWLSVVAAGCVAYWLSPDSPAGALAYALVAAGAAAAVVAGVRRHRPPDPVPWLLVAATLAVFFLADAVFAATYQATVRQPAPVADVLYLAGYAALFAGLARMLLRGGPDDDRTAPLDAAILAVAVAPLAWALTQGRGAALGASLPAQVLAAVYPLADVALVAAAALLLVGGAWAVAAGRWLFAAVVVLLAFDVAAGWLRLAGIDPVTSRANALWLVAAGAFGAAALHPSMTALPGAVTRAGAARGRFLLLGTATLVSPILFAIHVAGLLPVNDAAIAVAATAVAALVALRIAGIGLRLDEVLGRYRALVEQIPTAVYTRPVGDDALTYASPRFRDLLGVDPGQVVGRPGFVADRLHPDDRARVLALDEATDRSGEPFVAEYRLRASDGSWRWVRDEALLVNDGNGKPGHWQGVLADVSALKEAEESRRYGEQVFRSAFDDAPIGMALVAPGGRFLRVNRALCAIFGHDAAALLERTIDELAVPPVAGVDPAPLARTLAGELPGFRAEQRFRRADGTVVDAIFGASLVRDAAGQPVHAVCHVLDVSPQKAAEAALAAERDLLAALMAHLPDAVFVKDAERRFLRGNEAFAAMLGVAAPAALLGKTDADFLPPAAERRVAEGDRAVLAGAPDLNRLQEIAWDGRPHWVRTSKVPLRDPSGRVVGLVGVHREVTEEHLAGERLRAAEERYRSLIEHLPVAVYVDPAEALGQPSYVSPQIEDLLGFSPAEWLADPDLWLARIHPEDQAAVAAELARSRRDMDAFRLEYRALARDGRTVWLRDHAVLVRDAAGSPRYWQGVLLDVTERLAAEDALRRHAARLAAVIAAQTEVGAADPDPQAVMDVVARRAQALVGADGAAVELVEGDEIVYRSAAGTAAVYLGRRRPLDGTLSGLCVRTGRAQISADAAADPRVDAEAVRRSGARSAVVVPLNYRSGVVGVLKVLAGRPAAFDEDDARTLQLLAGLIAGALANAEAFAAMREARAAAEEASRLKSQFLSTMSHELRTPMNAIIGYAHLLLDGMAGPLSSAQNADVREIAAGADRLLALIDDVLDLSRIEAGRLTVEPRPTALAPVVDQVLAGVAPQAAAKGLAVRADVPADLPAVLADPDRLRQVLLNVVGNAVKFTDVGGVDIVARAAGEEVAVAVTDTGIGIEPGALPHVFDEFRQADSSTTRRFGGSGLGLAIARRLLHLQGGSIAVVSTPGKGSTFTVRLPTAVAAAAPSAIEATA